jgi:hypothetical protein
MNLFVKNSIRMILMLFIQAFILQKIPPLHQFIVPYFYFVFILWLPFRISRVQLLLVSFLTGSLLDFFYKTPGLHAAASSLIAYIRPYLITLLLPKEATEWGNQEPTSKNMGAVPYWTYMIIMTLLHHFWMIFLEWMQFGSFLYFMGKLLATSIVSIVLIMITDLFMNRNGKLR